jgi:hypothetical protein
MTKESFIGADLAPIAVSAGSLERPRCIGNPLSLSGRTGNGSRSLSAASFGLFNAISNIVLKHHIDKINATSITYLIDRTSKK